MLNITKIKNIIDEVIEKEGIDRSHLMKNGVVYYMNGNDGTEFDYIANGMTCEFYVFWKNNDGAIKLNQRRDKFVVYVYPEEDPYGEKYHKYEFDSPFNLYELCRYLKGTFDENMLFDSEIENWELDEKDYMPVDGNEEEEWY